MGFIEKLWDETIAGPTPDSGVGKLRKYNSFSASRSHAPLSIETGHMPISRSILLRSNSACMRNGEASADSGSLPSSPLGSSTPGSPFSPTTPRGTNNNKKLAKKKLMVDPKSPKGYDWIVLSALDR